MEWDFNKAMLLGCKPTGRKWGDKVERKDGATNIGGYKVLIAEVDSWNGGDENEAGQYWREVWILPPANRFAGRWAPNPPHKP
jgi:hypothetical protein